MFRSVGALNFPISLGSLVNSKRPGSARNAVVVEFRLGDGMLLGKGVIAKVKAAVAAETGKRRTKEENFPPFCRGDTAFRRRRSGNGHKVNGRR